MTDTTLSTSPSSETTSAAATSVEAAAQQLLLEISKTLLSSSLASTRGAIQVLQGLTGLLLTSYTTLLMGFGKEIGIDKIPALVAALPIVCYLLSLVSSFGQMALFRGERLTLGDLLSGMEAYEALVSAQRKQLILPLSLSLAGLLAVVVVTLCLLSLR